MSSTKRKIWTLAGLRERERNIGIAAEYSDDDYGLHDTETDQPHLGGQRAPPAAPWNGPYCQEASANSNVKMCHIASLPNADQCEAMLARVQREFEPIWQRRGYNILSVSEMCCCGDGLDRGGRKRRPQASNVLGFNMTRFGRSKSHAIHLRLRHPHNHTRLMQWEDVAGTMAHEMSHCVHGAHNAAFYKLMEQILEEHAVQAVGSMIPTPVDAYAGHGAFGTASTTAAPSAATATIAGNGSGNVLGGGGNGRSRLLDVGNTLGSSQGGTQRKNLTPQQRRQMVAKAAEARRRQMDQVRRIMERSSQPCVIEIMDDDDENINTQHNGRHNGRHNGSNGNASNSEIIDLVPHHSNSRNSNNTRQKRRGAGHNEQSRIANTNAPGDTNNGRNRAAQGKAAQPIEIDIRSPVASRPSATASKRQRRNKGSQTAPIMLDLVSTPPARSIILIDEPTPKRPPEVAIIERETVRRSDTVAAQWTCQKCTFRNRDMALACGMCRKSRR